MADDVSNVADVSTDILEPHVDAFSHLRTRPKTIQEQARLLSNLPDDPPIHDLPRIRVNGKAYVLEDWLKRMMKRRSPTSNMACFSLRSTPQERNWKLTGAAIDVTMVI
jgi:hypothetical protein